MPIPAGLPHRAFTWSGTYFVLGAATLMLDFFTGPFLQFPILFVVPVALAAWYCGPRSAYSLALMLPLGRAAIAVWIDHPSPYPYIIANALVRMALLVLIANLILRTARQTQALKQKGDSLVKICQWTPLHARNSAPGMEPRGARASTRTGKRKARAEKGGGC